MRLIGFVPRFSLATPQSRKMLLAHQSGDWVGDCFIPAALSLASME
jgi:hypothetical protein